MSMHVDLCVCFFVCAYFPRMPVSQLGVQCGFALSRGSCMFLTLFPIGPGQDGGTEVGFLSSSYGCFRLLKASQQICGGPIVILMASVNKGSGFIPGTPPCPQYGEAAESFLEGPVHSFQEMGRREGSLQI